MSDTKLRSTSINRLPLCALLTANGVSIIGNFMTLIALPWFVLEITGSAAKTGLVAMAITLPQALTGFFAGSLVDRLGYRRASILADLGAGAVVALVPLLSLTVGLAFWQLLALVFWGNMLSGPGNTARLSLLPDCARLAATDATRANAWFQGMFSAGFFIGPLLAGIAIPVTGTRMVLVLDAASFVASAVIIALALPVTPPIEARGTPYLAQLREGIAFIRNDRVLLGLALVAAAVSFLGPALQNVLLPIYARTVYGTPLALGVLRGAFGGGALVGMVMFGVVAPRIRRRTLLCATYLSSAIPLWVLLARPSLVLSAVALFVMAIAFAPTVPLRMAIYQERTPAAFRSRVFGAVNALMFVGAPLGTPVFGFIGEQNGVFMALALFLMLWLLLVLGVIAHPALRDMAGERQMWSPEHAVSTDTLAPSLVRRQ